MRNREVLWKKFKLPLLCREDFKSIFYAAVAFHDKNSIQLHANFLIVNVF